MVTEPRNVPGRFGQRFLGFAPRKETSSVLCAPAHCVLLSWSTLTTQHCACHRPLECSDNSDPAVNQTRHPNLAPSKIFRCGRRGPGIHSLRQPRTRRPTCRSALDLVTRLFYRHYYINRPLNFEITFRLFPTVAPLYK